MERILIFNHVKHEPARRYTDFADDEGIKYDVVKFWETWKKPDLDKYSRLIVMGGPQSVYDDDFDSKDFEIDVIKDFTSKGKPVLGCCLGSQLIADAFSARVYPNIINNKRFKETGYYKMVLVGKDPIFAGFSKEFDVFQWHGDIFELPKNSELLASGDFVKNQAFRIKNTKTYGMLFHLDFLPEMVEDMIKIDNKWLHKENNVDEKKMIKDAYSLEPKIKENSKLLFRNFMKL